MRVTSQGFQQGEEAADRLQVDTFDEGGALSRQPGLQLVELLDGLAPRRARAVAEHLGEHPRRGQAAEQAEPDRVGRERESPGRGPGQVAEELGDEPVVALPGPDELPEGAVA